MIPQDPLPLKSEWENTEEYVASLLSFATSSTTFRYLCGGVHILEFLTRDPDLYSTLFPEDWQEFFDQHSVDDILDLLLREDIEPLRLSNLSTTDGSFGEPQEQTLWRNGPTPPQGLLEYIRQIRRHTFRRRFTPRTGADIAGAPLGKIPHHVALGMKPKKVHEVEHFSRFVSSLVADIGRTDDGEPKETPNAAGITHIVDFGSGQNYLGRTLVHPPYNKHVIAIERKQENISGAKGKDSMTKLTKQKVVLRDRKKFHSQNDVNMASHNGKCGSTAAAEGSIGGIDKSGEPCERDNSVTVIHVPEEFPSNGDLPERQTAVNGGQAGKEQSSGHIDYVEHEIKDGYLEPIIDHLVESPQNSSPDDYNQASPVHPAPRVMVVSLHSCGNLVHHGIRSLILNRSVAAVAMIGCCYNLMTERLGPLTWKLPYLRSAHPRLERHSAAYDPHGFPMSRRLETYPRENGEGIILNITARMMAVQAPHNWGFEEREGFFTRHFYRSLFQRVLLDYAVVDKPDDYEPGENGGDARKNDSQAPALTLGSLRKSAYTSFPAYAQAAISKLYHNEYYGAAIREKVSNLTDDEFSAYEERYRKGRKNLSITWSMMAFSAQVVEAIIVTDRWLFLQEQEEVKHTWVEPVFDYSQSPRNLVVVGIKK